MSHWLIERIQGFGDRPCFAEDSLNASYADLAKAIQQFLENPETQKIKAGEIVALEADYSLSAVAALLALFEKQAIVAPVTGLSENELQSRIEEANAKWHIQVESEEVAFKVQSTQMEQAPHALVQQLIEANVAGLILFSSGSTGKPKAMIHNADRLLAPFAKKRARRLSILIFLLFDHIGGLNTLFNGLASGAKIVIPKDRDAHTVAHAIAAHSVTLLPASPTFLNLLLLSEAHTKEDLSSLRFITYGTEPMPESLLKRLKEALPHTNFIQTFGTSETGISQTVSRASNSTQIKIDDPDTEYKIVEGELWLRSKSQILGYLNHEMSRFTDDGWFKTGDTVTESGDGFLTITGRREDLINVGGEKVTPSEVESTLLELPEVADCLVYGEVNAITGQNVAAQIVPKSKDALPALKRRIKNHCRQQLAGYKVPARIRFVEAQLFNDRFKKTRNLDS